MTDMTEYFDLIKNERIVQRNSHRGNVAHESCAKSHGWQLAPDFIGEPPPLGDAWRCEVCYNLFNLIKRESSPIVNHFI